MPGWRSGFTRRAAGFVIDEQKKPADPGFKSRPRLTYYNLESRGLFDAPRKYLMNDVIQKFFLELKAQGMSAIRINKYENLIKFAF